MSKVDFDTTASTLYGTSSEVIGYIKGLFTSGETSCTITINDGEYTWDGTDFKDADGNANPTLPAGTYTVMLSLAEGYDAWSDGTTEDITYTFTVYAKMTTSTPTYSDDLFGDSSAVLTAIKGLFDTSTEASWTVTINDETYTYTGDTLTNATGDTVEELSAGTYTVVPML